MGQIRVPAARAAEVIAAYLATDRPTADSRLATAPV